MSGYLLGIIGIVLISAIITSILPDGKTSTVVKATAKTACLVTIVSPLVQFFNGETDLTEIFGKSVIETDGEFIWYCSTKRIESAEIALENELKEEFGGGYDVTLTWGLVEETEGSYAIDKIKIEKATVIGEEKLTKEECIAIENYVMTNFFCEAEVYAG